MGYIQITGRANYEKFRVSELGINEASNSILIPEVSARIAVEGMKEGTFTYQIGIYGSQKLDGFISSSQYGFIDGQESNEFDEEKARQDFRLARKIINPGELDRADDYLAGNTQYEDDNIRVQKIVDSALKYWRVLRSLMN
jgi:hypothetical protein